MVRLQALVQAAAGLRDGSGAEEGSPGMDELIVQAAVAVLSAAREPTLAAQRAVEDLQRCLAATALPSRCLLRLALGVMDLPAVCEVRCDCAICIATRVHTFEKNML